jgi:hypothetical protein
MQPEGLTKGSEKVFLLPLGRAGAGRGGRRNLLQRRQMRTAAAAGGRRREGLMRAGAEIDEI